MQTLPDSRKQQAPGAQMMRTERRETICETVYVKQDAMIRHSERTLKVS